MFFCSVQVNVQWEIDQGRAIATAPSQRGFSLGELHGFGGVPPGFIDDEDSDRIALAEKQNFGHARKIRHGLGDCR